MEPHNIVLLAGAVILLGIEIAGRISEYRDSKPVPVRTERRSEDRG